LNAAWEKTLGFALDELLATPALSFIHPEDIAPTIAELEKLIDGRPRVSFENRYRHANGSYRWFEWTSHYSDSDGLIYATARDITERKVTQEALRRSQDYVRLVIQNVPIILFTFDAQGIVTFSEGKGLHAQGLQAGQLVGQSVFDLYREDALTISNFQRALNGESFVSGRTIGPMTLVAFYEPVFDPTGKVESVIGIDVDLTEQTQTHQALEQSEKLLRQLLNGTQDIAFLSDIEGNVIAHNAKFAEQFGVTSENSDPINYYDLLPPSIVGQRKGSAQKVIQSRLPLREDVELHGQIFDYCIYPILDINQQVTSLARFAHDITHRKQIEQKLRNSEQQFRSVLESASEGIVITDATGAILLVNHHIEILFGYTRDELFGRSVELFVPEAHRDAHVELRQGFLSQPEARYIGGQREIAGKHKNGSIFPLDIHLSHVQRDDGEALMIAFIVDITERKQMEQDRLENQREQLELRKERELVELRQKFMSMVSHEFRTPLTVIATSCEMLLHYYDRLSREKQMDKLQLINAQVRSMVSLLDDILALSKIQAGAAEFVPEPLDLQALCSRILDNIKIVDQDHHAFTFIFDDIPPTIQADRRLLEHIITNLLSNAVKYSPENTSIFFSLLGGKDSVKLEICDQGIGIPPEDQSHLFEPFYRARNARTVSGTGLGLAIVKHNVEQHGGTITCHSVEGQGTTFTINLPNTG
jgi:PAS domain S-box-containing protein